MRVMAKERVRLVILVDEDLRAALKLEAAREQVDMSDLAADVLRKALTGALAEIRQRKEGEGKGRGKA